MMTKLHVPEAVRAATAAGASGAAAAPAGGRPGSAAAAGGDGAAAASVMLELLEATLWQRQLGSLSEEMVAALVCQVSALPGARRTAQALLLTAPGFSHSGQPYDNDRSRPHIALPWYPSSAP
jgi:hypothetical protein